MSRKLNLLIVLFERFYEVGVEGWWVFIGSVNTHMKLSNLCNCDRIVRWYVKYLNNIVL